MARDYIEQRDHAFYITGSRVPLAVIIHEYKNGASAESIRQSFPTLTLEQIHGALAFYHGNQGEVESSHRETRRIRRRPASKRNSTSTPTFQSQTLRTAHREARIGFSVIIGSQVPSHEKHSAPFGIDLRRLAIGAESN